MHRSLLPSDTVLFEQMEECVIICEADATCLYLNPAMVRSVNKPLAELVGRCLWEVFPEAAGRPPQEAFQRVAETGRQETFDYYSPERGRWFACRMYRGEGRVFVLGRDITGERERGDALRLHARILESMTEGVLVADEAGTLVYTNPALERMFGYGPGELLGRNMYVLTSRPPEESETFIAGIRARLREGGTWSAEVSNVRKDGTCFTTAVRVSALSLAGRQHWVSVREDVTERKRAEAERAEYHGRIERLYEETRRAERYAAFLAQASEVLASSLEHEQILRRLARLAVPTLADWCAVDVPTPEGTVRRVAVEHEDPRRVVQALAFHEKYPIRLDTPGGIGQVLRAGETMFIPDLPPLLTGMAEADPEQHRAIMELGMDSVISVPLISRGRVLGALTLVYAGSRRRFSEADVRLAEDLARRAATSLDNGRLYQEAQDAIRARDVFLSVASHELNTPLTSLALNVHALQRALEQRAPDGPPPDTVRVKLTAVRRQIERLANLVRELLDVSRITAGKLRLESEEGDFAALVRDMVPRFSEDLARAGCELRLRAPDTVPGAWDRLRVEQIVENLLSNAIKYGPRGPIDVRVEADADKVRLSVKDEGPGIAPKDRARLFQRFERLASERHYSGLGLGLWIVKQIVDAMGGRVDVESAPGQGSCFTVELPRRPLPPR